MITETLILSEGEKNKIEIGKEVIDAEIKIISDNIASQGSTLEEALTARGMKEADLEKQIKLQKIVEKLATANINISQAQIDEYLKTNKAQLPKGATKEELNEMAKEDLMTEASNEAINTWLEKIRAEAKIVVR
jgi:predicted DNA-binding antitoxin AbrB/MazE fold protein